jgi:anthranilate/para-aminobenzoate synthase component II
MIDNYDSFTYNLVQYLAEIGQEVEVVRNDKISIEEINKLNPQYIVISPGPCTPNEAGISLSLIEAFKGENSYFRSLSWASINRAGVWWKNYSCTNNYAW